MTTLISIQEMSPFQDLTGEIVGTHYTGYIVFTVRHYINRNVFRLDCIKLYTNVQETDPLDATWFMLIVLARNKVIRGKRSFCMSYIMLTPQIIFLGRSDGPSSAAKNQSKGLIFN